MTQKGVLSVRDKNKLTKQNKNIFFVSTALHLFNAIEAQHHFKTTNNILVLLFFGDKSQDETHIQTYLEYFPYDKLITFNVGNARRYHALTVELLNLINKYTYEDLFVGYFSANLRRIVCNIPSKKLFLYDDGTYSIALHNELYNPKGISNTSQLITRYSEKKRKTKFKQFKFLLYDYYREVYFRLHGYGNDFKQIKLDFFTIFHLTSYAKEKIVNHQFKRIQNIFQLSNKTSSTQEEKNIYFLGQPLDKALNISNDQYISYIIEIASHYKNNQIHFIYVPHRSENPSIVSNLALEKFEVLVPNIPFEIYLLENNIDITYLASFFSSALFTLKVLFPQIKVESFKIPFNHEKRNDIEAIYDTIRKENIAIHLLENYLP